jgi:hypothetical protein
MLCRRSRPVASNNERLAIGAADTVLKSDGTDPAYGKIVAANVTDGVLTHAKLASGVTATQANMEAASATDVFVPPGRQHFTQATPRRAGTWMAQARLPLDPATTAWGR